MVLNIFKKHNFVPIFISILTYLIFFYPLLRSDTFIGGNDAYRQYYPLRAYLYENLKEGRIPAYTEKIFAGFPVYADITAGYLNPLNILSIYLFGPFNSYKILHFLMYFLGSMSLYVFLKNKGFNLSGFFISNLVYFFSFFGLFHQKHFDITIGLYLIPVVLLYSYKYLEKRSFKNLLILAIASALILYFGSPQSFIFSLIVGVGYLFFHKESLRVFAHTTMKLIILTFILLLPVLIPTYDLYKQSIRNNNNFNYTEGSFLPIMAVNIAYPFLLGYGENYKFEQVSDTFLPQETYVYMGVTTLILFAIGLLILQKSPTQKYLKFLIIIPLILMFVGYIPVLSKVDLPILRNFRYWTRGILLFNIAAAYMSGWITSKIYIFRLSKLPIKKSIKVIMPFIFLAIFLEVFAWNSEINTKFIKILFGGGFRVNFTLLMWLLSSFLLVAILILKEKISVWQTKLLICLVLLFDLGLNGIAISQSNLRNIKDLYLPNKLSLPLEINKQRVIFDDNIASYNLGLYFDSYGVLGYSQLSSSNYDNYMKSLGFENLKLSNQSEANNIYLLESLNKSLGVNYVLTNGQPISYVSLDNEYSPFFKQGNYKIEYLDKAEGFIKVKITSDVDQQVQTFIKYYPEWRIFVNGNAIKPTQTGDSPFISINVNKGENVFEFKYVPAGLYKGLFLSTILLFSLIVAYLIKRKKILINKTTIFPLIILLLFLGLRLIGVGYDMSNSDAARWHRRSERFLDAIQSGTFVDTYQHYQPGVVIMWANSITKYLANKYQIIFTNDYKTLENADWFPIIDGVSKSVLVFILGFTLLFQYKLITRILGNKSAMLYMFFMAFEPYMIGIDRWFHLTSLETYFAFTAFLLLLVWVREKSNKFLILSALFLTLSILSKITSLSLIPLFIFIIAKNQTNHINLNIKSIMSLFPKVLTYLILIISFFFILFPAMWVTPSEVVLKIYNAIVYAVSNDMSSSYINGSLSFLFYLLVFIYKLSPITLLVFIISMFSLKKLYKTNTNITYVILYLLYYYLILSFPDKKIDRYVLVLIPPAILICSYYLSTIKSKLLPVCFATIIFTVFVCIKYYPVYSSYYSPIFGGYKKALDIGVYDNSGEYYAQAAFYLNSVGRDYHTFVPFNIESFSYYYKGKIQRQLDFDTNFVVTSVDHVKDVQNYCPKVVKTFGPLNESIVYIFECYH